MSGRKNSVSVVIALAALSFLFIAGMSRGEKPAAPAPMRLEGAIYGEAGPYPVGTRDLVIERDAPLEMVVWYPAVQGERSAQAITYAYEIKMAGPFGAVAVASYAGSANHDAPYDLSNGPYPLVILSPGFSIGVEAYAWLAEHLASYGFLVISPEHHEVLDPEGQLWQAAVARPQDVLALLAYVDEQVGPNGELEGLADPERVAVVGHSYGGYTALAAAGARVDTVALNAHCARAQETDDPAAWLCDMLMPHIADMAELAGLDPIPDGLWPAWADPRVDALVSMAGDAFFFGQSGLAEITAPAMAIGGTADRDSPFMWGTQPAYEYVSSSKKVKIALTGAEHMIFTGPCEAVRWYLKFFSGEFCDDAAWDRALAHDLVNHFTTAFLLAELKGDPAAAAVLVPEKVEFPDLEVQAEGY